MKYSREDLEHLINIATGLVLQLEEFIKSDEVDIKAKEFSATNIVLIDTLTKNALGLQFSNIDGSKEQNFIQIYQEALMNNYQFAKKIITSV